MYSSPLLSLFVPVSAPKIILDLLKMYPIDLNVTGANWNEANQAADKFIASQPKSTTFFVHPFDQESIYLFCIFDPCPHFYIFFV
jgi:threonine dehydratase